MDNYFAVVPPSVRYNKDLTPLDRNVYLEIAARCNSKGHCWPSNRTLSDMLGVAKETVSRSITKLIKAGHVNADIKEKARILSIPLDLQVKTLDVQINTLDAEIKGHDVQINTPCATDQPPLDVQINQRISKLKNKKPPISPKGEDVAITTSVREVIDHLNKIVGGRFRMTSGNVSCIKARLNDGFTVEDCKDVINGQASAWLNEKKMRPFLRPATLFLASKFEGYLTDATRNKPVSRQKVTWLSPEVWQDENGTNHTGPPPPGAPPPPDGKGMRMAAGQEGDQWFF